MSPFCDSVAFLFSTRSADCSPIPEQRDFVTKIAHTNANLLELELNDSGTPVSRTVYLISVANS